MTRDELALLWRFKGGHSLARAAAHPADEIACMRASMHERWGPEGRIATKADGIHLPTGKVLTWAAIRAHAEEHTPTETRAWIQAFDREWCRMQALTHPYRGHSRRHTDDEKARAAQCERWLRALAWEVWNPGTAEPEQLDLLDALGAA